MNYFIINYLIEFEIKDFLNWFKYYFYHKPIDLINLYTFPMLTIFSNHFVYHLFNHFIVLVIFVFFELMDQYLNFQQNYNYL